MSSWVVRLGTQSAGSLFCGNSLGLPEIRLGRLLATLFFVPGSLLAQLTTGSIEGTLRDMAGHPLAGATIVVNGATGFHAVIRTNPNGGFAITLPDGEYRLSGEVQHRAGSSALVFVPPLQTVRIDFVAEASGTMRVAQTASWNSGIWTDATSGRLYPEAFSLQGILLSREPSSVTAPLDFTGLGDNRLVIEPQRGFSWTDTQYKLHGMDATDSYQPGLPVILPDVQALGDVVVRSAFAQSTSSSFGTEVGLFLAEPGASWHGALSTAHTGAAFSSMNLPAPDSRGLVQQADEFSWFTRDRLEIGG